jgi:hypothetical protein
MHAELDWFKKEVMYCKRYLHLARYKETFLWLPKKVLFVKIK